MFSSLKRRGEIILARTEETQCLARVRWIGAFVAVMLRNRWPRPSTLPAGLRWTNEGDWGFKRKYDIREKGLVLLRVSS